MTRRVGSSMVEQRPFKALVVGSSPTQPTPLKGRSERCHIAETAGALDLDMRDDKI
jgi:hypothetical protein